MTQVQQNNIQDLDDLAAQVEELVDELSEACEKVSKRLSDDGSEEEDAAPENQAETAEPEDAAEAADAKSDDAPETTGEDETGPADREPHPAEAALDDLEHQLDDLIEAGAQAEADTDEAVGQAATVAGAESDAGEAETAPGKGEPTVSAIDAEDIDDLDQQIAELTDELLDGDFTDAGGEPVGDAAAPVAQQERRASDKPAKTQQAAPEAEPASQSSDDEAEENDAAQAAAEDEDESEAEVAQDAPAPKPSPARRATVRAAATPKKGPHPVVVVLLSVASKTDAGARTLADLLATPLKNRPKIIRDTVGWFGLWTLFLAICVWMTLAFFRSPEHPEAEGEPMRIRSADESSAPPPANQRPLPHPEAVRSAASPR